MSELRATAEARTLVRERYLDGHLALFPDLAAAWGEQVKRTVSIADMAVRLAEIHEATPPPPSDSEALSARTTELVVDLVEPAKAEVLESLGDGHRALGIAAGWLRTKLSPMAQGGPDRGSATRPDRS